MRRCVGAGVVVAAGGFVGVVTELVGSVVAPAGAGRGAPGCASAWADESPAPGEQDIRDLVRSLGASTEASRKELCAKLAAHEHPGWAAAAALECVSAAEDRLAKAVAERDKQGAKMFAFFERKVAKDFENRAKFTEFRMMEIENRTLCGVVQEWARAVDALQEAGRSATARVDAPDAAAPVAERVRRLVGLGRRPTQQAAVLGALSGAAPGVLAADLHEWAAPSGKRELCVAAMRLLATIPDRVEVERFRACAQDGDPVVRRVAYRLLARVGTVPAMDVLVERTSVEEGIPAVELARYLYNVTGEAYGLNATAWREWWAAQREGWRSRPDEAVEVADVDRQPYSRYFGLELKSARILFVLDRSGSMSFPIGYRDGMALSAALGKDSKMDVAVRELSGAIKALDERVSFNVVAFGTGLESFQRRPVRATRENREKAAKWVARLVPDGQTNLAGSLLAAFENTRPGPGVPDESVADTLVVLTDGAPNCGPIAYENDTLAELRRLNQDGWVAIHAIFLGIDGDEAFMKSLASEHGGKFIHHTR